MVPFKNEATDQSAETRSLREDTSLQFVYVEKKTCEFAERALRTAGSPRTIGAGSAEIGFVFESFTSNSSILRCSCG